MNYHKGTSISIARFFKTSASLIYGFDSTGGGENHMKDATLIILIQTSYSSLNVATTIRLATMVTVPSLHLQGHFVIIRNNKHHPHIPADSCVPFYINTALNWYSKLYIKYTSWLFSLRLTAGYWIKSDKGLVWLSSNKTYSSAALIMYVPESFIPISNSITEPTSLQTGAKELVQRIQKNRV